MLAHLQIAALAKNLSMLDSLEEDLVKAFSADLKRVMSKRHHV